MNILEYAFKYADLGWPVVILHGIKDGKCTCGDPDCSSPGKHPRTPHGLKDATTDKEVIEEWFHKWPHSNIGIVMGKQSGIFALDVDGVDGVASLKNFLLPKTPYARTGNGFHFLFNYPEDIDIRPKVKLLNGVDLRGDDSYIVAPPSIHPKGVMYRWLTSPFDVPVEDPPSWLIDLIKEDNKRKLRADIYTGDRIDPKKVLEGVPEGMRNETLFRYACSLRARGVAREEALALVLQAAENCQPPLPEKEARRVVDSAWRYEPRIAHIISEAEQVHKNGWTIETKRNRLTLVNNYTGLRAVVSNITAKGTDIHGILKIEFPFSDKPTLIHQAKLNFLSSRSRKEYENALNQRVPDFGWNIILERIANEVMEYVARGEPAIQLTQTEEEPSPPAFLLPPLIYDRQPVILFGQRGAGKSLLGQAIALSLATGENFINSSPIRPLSVLVLDWETEQSIWEWRNHCLLKGQQIYDERLPIYYRRCVRPLCEDVDQVSELIDDLHIDFVVIDSLGPACGGNLNDPDRAIRYFEALRSLKVSSLTIAHVAKNAPVDKRTVFGSSYFENLARSIWEAIPHLEWGADELAVALKHKKNNFGKLHPPIGLKFVFESDAIYIYQTNPEDIPELEETASYPERILSLLGYEGRLKASEISEYLEIPLNIVRITLSRLKRRGKVTNFDDNTWGLLEQEEADV